jgi:hypothetical protein
MKKITLTFSCCIFAMASICQNVGVGTINPLGKLHINGRFNATNPGLLITDSAGGSSGIIKLQNANNPIRIISLSGFSLGNSASQSYLDVNSDSVLIATFKGNGNVGIGNYAPAYKLDVAGDINFTGTLKANADAGLAGQVLQSNGPTAAPTWTSPTSSTPCFQNMVVFNGVYTNGGNTAHTWVVPAGVTKIQAEVWGGGGGSNTITAINRAAGGGGGGYARAFFTVVPGTTITINVGQGAFDPQNGGPSSLSVPSSGTLTANGGTSATTTNVGFGGTISALTMPFPYVALYGEHGTIAKEEYLYNDILGIYDTRIIHRAKGGDAGNTQNTGSYSSYEVYKKSAGVGYVNVLSSNTPFARIPGGGGGSGAGGAPGQVIIHY